jgi:hypothetical protein
MRISPLSVSLPDVKPTVFCNGVTGDYAIPDFINGAFFSNSVMRGASDDSPCRQAIRVDAPREHPYPTKNKPLESK